MSVAAVYFSLLPQILLSVFGYFVDSTQYSSMYECTFYYIHSKVQLPVANVDMYCTFPDGKSQSEL